MPIKIKRLKVKKICLALILSVTAVASWAEDQVWCAYDPIGSQGDITRRLNDIRLYAQQYQVKFKVVTYQKEQQAIQAFDDGKCSGLAASNFNTYRYNQFMGSTAGIGLIPNNRTAKSFLQLLNFVAANQPGLSPANQRPANLSWLVASLAQATIGNRSQASALPLPRPAPSPAAHPVQPVRQTRTDAGKVQEAVPAITLRCGDKAETAGLNGSGWAISGKSAHSDKARQTTIRLAEPVQVPPLQQNSLFSGRCGLSIAVAAAGKVASSGDFCFCHCFYELQH